MHIWFLINLKQMAGPSGIGESVFQTMDKLEITGIDRRGYFYYHFG